MAASTTPSFSNIINFRDVAISTNTISGSNILKPGLLYRAARPDEASASDRDQLLNGYRIKTIIDLRSKTEHINASKKHSDGAAIAQSAAVPSSNEAIAAPLKISGIKYAEINLNGKGFERALLWKLSWSSMAKLVGLMTMGYRNEGISILGSQVMQPRGLIGLGLDTLQYSGKEIKEVFDVLADRFPYPVMVHCTQGKDRTGLTILLVLMLCHVPDEAIDRDYLQSEPELQPEMESRLQEIKSIGLDETFAGCPKDFVPSVTRHITQHYGGVEQYLRSIGVNDKQQASIKDMLKN